LHPGRWAAGSQRIVDGTWCRRHRSPEWIGRSTLGLGLRLHSRIGAAHAASDGGTTPAAKRIVLADQTGQLSQRIGVTTAHLTAPAWIETI
jgi:hypothetical protein